MDARKLRTFFIYAPRTIADVEGRGRAELIQGVLLARLLAVIALYLVLASQAKNGLNIIAGVIAVTVVAYLVSRTKHYVWGAIFIIAEPMVGVPSFVATNEGSLYILISAPIWLGLGPFLGSLIFKPVVTSGILLLTGLSFTAVVRSVDPTYRPAVISQFLAVFCSSALALIGNVIRERNHNVLRDERAKTLNTSRLASLGEMAAGVAHELNSPLAAVRLNLEMVATRFLNGTVDPARALSRVRASLETVDRMANIVNGMRTFARDDADETASDAPVSTWVEDTLTLCRHRFMRDGVTLEVDGPSLEVRASARRGQLSRAMFNLVNNAFEAARLSPAKWVRVSARATAGSVEVSIVDGGATPDESARQKLFEPFYTTKPGGVGLGLCVSRDIVRGQGGDLVFKPAEHTTFVIRLPV